MAQKPLPKVRIPSAKSDDQPATRKMLRLVRDELKAEIGSVRTELESKIGSVRTELKAEIAELRSEVSELRTDVHGLRSEFDGFKASQIRMELLLEEQNAKALWQRQETLEAQRG